MQCAQCRATMPADANFCSHCGAPRTGLALGQTTKLGAAKAETLRAGRCPVCLSTEVYVQSGALYAHPRLELAESSSPQSPINSYACVQCGYMEMYLTEYASVDMIQRRWKRVQSDF